MELKKIIREELLKENVEQYLNMISKVTSGDQNKYYQWQIDNLTKVPIESYKSGNKLESKVNDLIKRMNRFGGSDSFCQKKGCFDTAYSTTMYISSLDIHYVEGYVDSLIPIVHAWNYFPEENIYFDLINDVAWDGEDSHFKSYYKIVTMDRNEVAKWSSITGYGGGFMESPQYIQSIIENE